MTDTLLHMYTYGPGLWGGRADGSIAPFTNRLYTQMPHMRYIIPSVCIDSAEENRFSCTSAVAGIPVWTDKLTKCKGAELALTQFCQFR